MTKIPFTLEAWIKDKSQRVETRDGRIVHDIWPVEPLIVCRKKIDVCALIDGEEDALVFFEGGKYLPANAESPFDLFIVTQEEELTEWEKGVRHFSDACARRPNYVPSDGDIRIWASELLELAKKELIEELESRERNAFYHGLKNGKEQVKAEALRTRATELTENLAKSGLDKDSIPYHLIEFMCNLYDSQNWKEIEETAELYVTRIKAAAMKDLPRWENADGHCFVGPSLMYDKLGFYESSTTKPECLFIPIEDLKKLPGFKED